MASPFVRSEWQRALALARPNFVRPVYWEDPLPGRDVLPTALGQLHFQRIAWAKPDATVCPDPFTQPSLPSAQTPPESLRPTEPGMRPVPKSAGGEQGASSSRSPLLPLAIVVVLLIFLFFLFT